MIPKVLGLELNYAGFMVFCAIGFFAGARYEVVNTLKAENDFTSYKLAATEKLNAKQQELVNARHQFDNDLLVAGIANEQALKVVNSKRVAAVNRLQQYEAAATAAASNSASGAGSLETANSAKLLRAVGEEATGIIAECDAVREDYILARTYIDNLPKVCR